MDKNTERMLAMALHLSGFLSGFMFPIVVALVIWLLKKDESNFIDEHGKSALNFQITMLVIGIGATLFSFFTFGLGLIIILPLAIILGLFYIIFIIIATINASGGLFYKYPICFEFIK